MVAHARAWAALLDGGGTVAEVENGAEVVFFVVEVVFFVVGLLNRKIVLACLILNVDAFQHPS